MPIAAILFALVLSMPGVAAAQEWEEYISRQDSFTVNFPGQPKITETTWLSQLGTRCRRASIAPSAVENGSPPRWLTTVLSSSRGLPAGSSVRRETPSAAMGPDDWPGYWKQDERGAIVFAVAKYLKRPTFEVTDYAWDWQDMVEGHVLQLKGEGMRTLVYIAMHNRKLYILEGAAPEEHPEPGLFTQSMGYLDKDGKRIRYTDTVYSNWYHGLGVYPAPGVPGQRAIRWGISEVI